MTKSTESILNEIRSQQQETNLLLCDILKLMQLASPQKKIAKCAWCGKPLTKEWLKLDGLYYCDTACLKHRGEIPKPN